MKKRIAIVFTGGTIASKLDEDFGGIVPSLSGSQILDAVPDIRSIADIELVEFGKYPGPHITPELMFTITKTVRALVAREEIDGVVVTHGTDTLEETAFFLDCAVNTVKPVVVIGAMRNSSEPDWDGPRNLRDAMIIASSGLFEGYGTLVCLAGLINSASEVSKTDTEEINTFRSYDFGPVARISNGDILRYRRPLHRQSFDVTRVPDFVPLFKCYSGMDGDVIDWAHERNAGGIVIEAFGVGNVPPPVFYALKRCVDSNIPVVLVSRCPVGRTEHIYAYEGAGKQLYDAGVIFSDFLNGQKARIKLICALGSDYPREKLRSIFEWV